jgi:hypothetical protein
MPVKVARGWDLEEDDMKQWSAQTGAGDSIIGAAEFLRQWHKVPDDKAVLVQDKIGGQYDVSWSISEDDRILQKEHRAKSLILGIFWCCGSTVYGGRFWLLV